MTDEDFIEFEGNIDVSKLTIQDFSPQDVTDEMTDHLASKKLVDEKGNVLMLIEVVATDYCSQNEAMKNERGCFIKRFKFDERLINSPIWENLLKASYTSVRYALLPCESGFQVRYTYLWAQMPEDEQCVIGEAIGLDDAVIADGEIKTYIRYLKDE